MINVIPIPIQKRTPYMYVGQIHDEKLLQEEGLDFYLSIRATAPYSPRSEFVLESVMISSGDEDNHSHISEYEPLKSSFSHEYAPPLGIPIRDGHYYFRLDKLSTFWKKVKNSKILIMSPLRKPLFDRKIVQLLNL